MQELIRYMNEKTGFRVELIYYVDATTEGYKAQFFSDKESEIKEVYDNPFNAVVQLAKNYNITF